MSSLRVLIIANNAIATSSNNGKTLLSFIRDLPASDVAQFYTGTNEFPALSAANNFYRVTESQVLKSIINLSFKTHNSHEKHRERINGLKPGEYRDNVVVRKLKHQAKNLALFRELIWATNSWDTRELNNWIEEFRPNAIFAVLGNCIFLHNIAKTLSSRYKLPLSVFFTDDYVINDNSVNIFQKIHYKRLCRKYEETLRYAVKAFVIGDLMSAVYKNKYNREFGILVNGIDFSRVENYPLNKIKEKGDVNISFIGGIHLNRWVSICKIGKILKEIDEYRIRLRVYCVEKPTQNVLNAFLENKVEFCGRLTPQEVVEEIGHAHILLHVESFDETNRLYTKFSISTKIPEYLSSRRGVIAFGPHEVASIRLFIDNNIGCPITDRDNEDCIKSKILKYLQDYNHNDFSKEYEYAKSNFNAKKMLLSKVIPHI